MSDFQSAHGLENIRGIDEKRWWMDILNMHYFPDQKEDILSKHQTRYAVTQMDYKQL